MKNIIYKTKVLYKYVNLSVLLSTLKSFINILFKFIHLKIYKRSSIDEFIMVTISQSQNTVNYEDCCKETSYLTINS